MGCEFTTVSKSISEFWLLRLKLLRSALAYAMEILSLGQVSTINPGKASKRTAPSLANSSVGTRFLPFHHQSLAATSVSPLRNSRANKTLKMGVQMKEVAAADQSPAPQLELVKSPTVIEIIIPPESLEGFEADYERASAKWPADLPTTTDDTKIEQFVTSAHALVRRWLPEELVFRLERFMYDPQEPPALVIRGLPIDKEMPPTETDAHLKKAGKCMSETWLVGIGRIVGQVFIYSYLRGSRTGMGMLARDLYPTPEKMDLAIAEGSRKPLDFHKDFFFIAPEKFPYVLAFIGIRGDPTKEGKTLLCNDKILYRSLDPADVEVLRAEKVTWQFGNGNGNGTQFSRHIIEGSESNPQFNLFEENLPDVGGFDKSVRATPAAMAAYKRVKEVAQTLAEGVWLDSGDVLLLNQHKTTHGRTPYPAKFDGNDRWMQRIYINNGGFWEAGITQWPSRSVPYP